MGAAPALPTFDELYATLAALPEGQHGEILGPGWIRVMSRPSGKHARSATKVARVLDAVDARQGGDWWIDHEREIVFPGEKLYVPDLAGWRVGDGDLAFVDDNPITRIPDWACEILSRSNQKGDRVVKLPTYIAAGVGHVWVVDPEAETVEVYVPREGNALLVCAIRASERMELPPFGLPISVEELLRMRPPPPVANPGTP
jgi:Uma2 family endonuclease